MNEFAGNGEILLQSGFVQLLSPVGSDVGISDSFQVMNDTNFPDIIFIEQIDGLFDFDETSGVFILKNTGYLRMSATLNFSADQASANLLMIPEFDFGSGWVPGFPRKQALTAIRPMQFTWSGERSMNRGDKVRFCFAQEDGNISFCTEILDEGGPLEAILPAAIFNVSVSRIYSNLAIK